MCVMVVFQVVESFRWVVLSSQCGGGASLDMRQISHHEDSARSALLCSESHQPGEVGLLPARDLQCEGSSVRAPPAPGSKARILLANWILRSPTSIQVKLNFSGNISHQNQNCPVIELCQFPRSPIK